MPELKMDNKTRLYPLDLLRGTLIVLMALDHANFLIARQHSSGEYWGGSFPTFSSPLGFLTRFVTHLCAPGFFFLLGVSMVLFSSSRLKQGWSENKVRTHFLVRGLVLIAFQGLLNLNQVWAWSWSSAPRYYVGVLAALGAGMILSIPLLGLKPTYLALAAGGLFLGLELLSPEAALWGRNLDHMLGVLLIYGGGKAEFWVNYPLLAWLEVAVLGLWFGKLLTADADRAYRAAGRLGGIFMAGFTVLRLLNGFGNLRPLPLDDWQGFLSVVKYPPSLVFILLTMGINLVALWGLSLLPRAKLSPRNPLLVLGRTALFSYLGHIGIYIALGRLLTPAGSSLGVMYPLWILGLGILYLPAYWYSVFKSKQPSQSWVRFV